MFFISNIPSQTLHLKEAMNKNHPYYPLKVKTERNPKNLD
jgi:hypothetical protein